MKLGGFPAAGRGSSTQDRVWAPQGFGSLGAPPPAPTPNTGPAGAARPAPCWGPEVLQAEGAGRFPLFQGLREGAPEPRCWGVLKTWQARTDASGQFLSPPAPRNTCREETTAGFLGLQQPLAAVRVCRSAARPRGNLPPPPRPCRLQTWPRRQCSPGAWKRSRRPEGGTREGSLPVGGRPARSVAAAAPPHPPVRGPGRAWGSLSPSPVSSLALWEGGHGSGGPERV